MMIDDGEMEGKRLGVCYGEEVSGGGEMEGSDWEYVMGRSGNDRNSGMGVKKL